jgi:hypothetical protein
VSNLHSISRNRSPGEWIPVDRPLQIQTALYFSVASGYPGVLVCLPAIASAGIAVRGRSASARPQRTTGGSPPLLPGGNIVRRNAARYEMTIQALLTSFNQRIASK